MISSGTNLVMTVIGFTVSTTFIVFVCTRLICARIQLRAHRSFLQAAASDRTDLSVLERGIHGLEPVVVASFPTKNFSDELSSEQEDTQCTICLADYQEKDILRKLPYCGHTFHVNCIDRWLQLHSTCPVCRISLRDFSERKRMLPPMFSSMVRTPYGHPDAYDSRSYRCVHNGHLFASRILYDQRMEPIQEDNYPLDIDNFEIRNANHSQTERNHIPKAMTTNRDELLCKHVESPSNS